MEQKENILGTEKIGKLLLTYSIPGIISMFVNSIYNLVDQIFIGRGVGYLGNGATTVSFPFTSLLLALALMTAAGTAANAGLNLGMKEQDRADRFVANGFTLSIFWGVFLLVLGEIFLVPLLNLFGATEEILPYAVDYSRIVLIGFPFVTTAICMNDIIRTDGSPRYTMVSMMSGAITNIILDYVFVFVIKWGVSGAALATIIGQMLTFVISLRRFRKLCTFNFKRAYMRPELKRISQIMIIGLSAFLTQTAMMVSNIILNNQAAKYGAMSIYGENIPLTVFGVNGKILGLMMSIILGITTSTQPIFAYNYGARLYNRVGELVKKACIATFVVGCIGCAIFQIFPQQIISLFGSESDLYNEFAVMCMRNMTMMIFVMGVPMLAGTYFQAIGKPMQAIVLSLSRQLLFLIPLILIMPIYYGIKGIMWSYPISDIFSITLATILLTKDLRRLKTMEDAKQN